MRESEPWLVAVAIRLCGVSPASLCWLRSPLGPPRPSSLGALLAPRARPLSLPLPPGALPRPAPLPPAAPAPAAPPAPPPPVSAAESKRISDVAPGVRGWNRPPTVGCGAPPGGAPGAPPAPAPPRGGERLASSALLVTPPCDSSWSRELTASQSAAAAAAAAAAGPPRGGGAGAAPSVRIAIAPSPPPPFFPAPPQPLPSWKPFAPGCAAGAPSAPGYR